MTRNDSDHAPKRPKAPLRQYIAFILVGIVLMIILDFFVWDERPYVDEIKRKAMIEEQLQSDTPPKTVKPADGTEYFQAPEDLESYVEEEVELKSLEEVEGEIEETPEIIIEEDKPEDVAPDIIEQEETSVTPAPKNNSAPAKIAIVIDDVGMNLSQSRAAINLPKEVTLAFLPYADKVKEMAVIAKNDGHELIIHAPMEAMNTEMDLGPVALRTSMDYASFDKAFALMTESFEGYIGVNNHMGSRLTQAPEQMGYLMDQLKRRNLFFLDSRTIHTSIAVDMARAYGIPSISRDVFLDHEETEAYVQKALRNVERIAREQGQVVAIGHPKAITMQALNKWIPTLKEKNMVLVPLSKLVKDPSVKIVQSQEVN